MKNRGVEIVEAVEMAEGEGALVRRAFPTRVLANVDPFVLMDEFFVDPPAGFTTHPHRGFEAITYMLEGSFIHEDTAGNRAKVERGGVQRVTMGKGVRHSEMPGSDKRSHGIQLWVNLPRRLKGIEPEYQIVGPEELPLIEGEGKRTRVIVGDDSPVTVRTNIEYRDIELSSSEHLWMIEAPMVGFVYVISGKGTITVGNRNDSIGARSVVIKKGSTPLSARLTARSMRFIALKGIPHGEPINQHGPYVD